MSGEMDFRGYNGLAMRVGHFLLNFGTLEYLVLILLEKNLSEKEYERISRFHFKDKVVRALDIIGTADPVRLSEEEALKLNEDIETVRVLRNHLAHGHLMTDLVSESGPRIGVVLARDAVQTSEAEVRTLDISELQQGLDILGRVTNQFRDLCGYSKSGSSGAMDLWDI